MVFPLRSAAGDYRPFLTRIQPYRDQHGRITHWFGNNVDISAQRAAEEALKLLNDSLESKVREEVAARQEAQARAAQAERILALGQLAGGIAHDFNNVLQVISSGVRMLRSPRVPESQKATLLDSMERSAVNAAELVRQLLAVARKQPLRPEIIDINERLRSVSHLLRQTAGSHIQWEIDIQPSLPAAVADPDQFEMALFNLIVNACEAMPNGGTLTLKTRS